MRRSALWKSIGPMAVAAAFVGLSPTLQAQDASIRPAAAATTASSAEPSPVRRTSPPPITPLRYPENYGYLRDTPNRSADPWEGLKYIPLADDPDRYLSLGIDVRVRYEAYYDNTFEPPDVTLEDYVWTRVMPSADLHLGRNVRVFGQLISAFKLSGEPLTPVDENRIDVLQGFAEAAVPLPSGTNDAPSPLKVRAGRQLLSYGTERLIGIRYGPNLPQPFDVALLTWKSPGADGVKIDAFWGRPVALDPEPFDDSSDDTRSLWSLYATLPLPAVGPRSGIDAYYIGFTNDAARFAQGPGDETRHTLGTRLFGTRNGWQWNYELFWQFGSYEQARRDGDILAWSAASETSYTFADLPLKPTIGLRANIISGDRDAGDADLQTFNPLFPRGRYFGEMGLIGPYNLINAQPFLTLSPTDDTTITLASVLYWRQTTGDGVYNNGGRLIRAAGDSDERYIGTQFDVLFGYSVDRNLSFEAAYSVLIPGEFLDDTGRAETIHFIAVEVVYRF
jgi:hypothetical protein